MQFKFSILCVFVLGSLLASAQCDSFKVDFDLGPNSASATIEVCPPAYYSFRDLTTMNFRDTVVDCEWRIESLEPGHPVVALTDPGDYDVALYVSTKNGCKETRMRKDYLHVVGSKLDFHFDKETYCYEETPLLLDSSEWNGRKAKVSFDAKDWFPIKESSNSYPYSMHTGKYNPLLVIDEELYNPITKEYETCRRLYPDPGSDKRWSLFKKNPIPIYYSVKEGYVEIDSAHLYSNFYWQVGTGRDAWKVQDSLKLKLDYSQIVELHVYDGSCWAHESFLYESIHESSDPFNLSYSQTTHRLSIETPEHTSGTLAVYNVAGGLMIQRPISVGPNVNLSFLQPGVYLAQLESQTGVSTLRFIKH